MEPLIDITELHDRLDEVLVRDVRWALTDPSKGRTDYEAGHVPGAVFVDLDSDLSAAPVLGRHPLPTPEVFAETLGRLGISPDAAVVVYDDMGGTIAARMWWMLRAIGHGRVRVLDGGYEAWVRAGKPVEVGDIPASPAHYPAPDRFTGVVEREQLAGRVVVDARAPERYRGDVEPVDPKAGHIPGAVNRPTADNLGPDGRFLNPVALAALYADTGQDAVMSCGSGVTACHDALAMVIAGYDAPDVYIGSFSEWSRLDLPVSTGAEP